MTNNNLYCFIQARLTSQRFPHKILSVVKKKTVIEILLKKIKKIKKIDRIIVLIPKNKKNEKLALLLKKLNYDYFKGSEKDVLDRFYNAYKKFKPKNIIRITADCPLLDISLLTKFIKKFSNNKFDYVSNTLVHSYPDGMDIEIFKSSALIDAWENAKSKYEREHVTPYIKNNDKFKKYNFFNKVNQKNIRLTLDWKDDFVLIKKIFEYNHPNIFFGLKEINKLIIKYPKWFKINSKYNVQ